ncbi:aldose epimerase family protein [Haploplasma modicum]|uniref:aldose epimerase family protein n=1 Tax=Haploplasma modicum TaxID=2150 RepID=UPI00047CCEA4|nr:aldose epimerase family protein [Haploplasma modicum]
MEVYKLENKYQKVEILSFAATIYKWYGFKDMKNIVITNKELKDYKHHGNGYLGKTIGRVTNRIKDGVFHLNGIKYELDKNFGTNSGHGGPKGFSNKNFNLVKKTNNTLILKATNYDMEDGYPGDITLFVTYKICKNSLKITYKAKSNKDTILNITNHSYFNLSDEKDILNHRLYMDSNRSLEIDETQAVNGNILNNSDTLLDFRENNFIRDIIKDESFIKLGGIDNFFLFNRQRKILLSYNNKKLLIRTSYPGAQIYSANFPLKQPLLERQYVKHVGLAIEPSFEPDAINHDNFSNIILKKDKTYKSTIKYCLKDKKDV